MGLLLVVLCVATVTAAEFLAITRNYHGEIGIPEARRIKLAEESMDFDGARITGGQTSLLGNQPHLGGLLIDLTINVQSVCGSSLISPTRLVTAAHCWRHGNFHGRQLTVVLGSVHLFRGGIRQLTNRVTMHPNYREHNLHNDVAIITINRVATNNAVTPIRIPTGNNDYVGAWATAAGFGRTEEGGQIGLTQMLHQVNLQVISNQACARVFGNDAIIASTLCTATSNGQSTCGGDSGGALAIGTGVNRQLVDLQVISNQACARVFGNDAIIASTLCTATSNGQSTCGGDSGGALTIGTGVNRQLIGIISFNHRDGCTRGHPAGFARVTSFSGWINSKL